MNDTESTSGAIVIIWIIAVFFLNGCRAQALLVVEVEIGIPRNTLCISMVAPNITLFSRTF